MIAIKDMEMPKSCAKCKLCEYNEYIGYYCVANNGGKFTLTREEMKEKRLDDCPLVEIVTCKECKHRDKVHPSWLSNKKDEVYFCTLQSDEYCYEVEDDHFCADGKRRE